MLRDGRGTGGGGGGSKCSSSPVQGRRPVDPEVLGVLAGPPRPRVRPARDLGRLGPGPCRRQRVGVGRPAAGPAPAAGAPVSGSVHGVDDEVVAAPGPGRGRRAARRTVGAVGGRPGAPGRGCGARDPAAVAEVGRVAGAGGSGPAPAGAGSTAGASKPAMIACQARSSSASVSPCEGSSSRDGGTGRGPCGVSASTISGPAGAGRGRPRAGRSAARAATAPGCTARRPRTAPGTPAHRPSASTSSRCSPTRGSTSSSGTNAAASSPLSRRPRRAVARSCQPAAGAGRCGHGRTPGCRRRSPGASWSSVATWYDSSRITSVTSVEAAPARSSRPDSGSTTWSTRLR